MGCNGNPKCVSLEFYNHIVSVKNGLSILIDSWNDTNIVKIDELVDRCLSQIGLEGLLFGTGAKNGNLECAITN